MAGRQGQADRRSGVERSGRANLPGNLCCRLFRA